MKSATLLRTALKTTAALTLLAGALLAAPQAAKAQVVFDRTNTIITLGGNATTVFDTWWDSVFGIPSLRLTAANVGGGQAGAVLLALADSSSPSTGFVSGRDVPSVRQWDVDFQYRADKGGGADGLAFVIRTGSAPNGLLAVGGGLGYVGTHCFAIEFDTFDNGGGENGVQAMLSAFGGSASPVSENVRPSFNLRGVHRVKITCRFRNNRPPWDNRDRIISVYMDGNANPLLTVWVPAAYLRHPQSSLTNFGFSAGTGGLADEHLIFPDWRVTVF
jgi:hypothetical protein